MRFLLAVGLFEFGQAGHQGTKFKLSEDGFYLHWVEMLRAGLFQVKDNLQVFHDGGQFAAQVSVLFTFFQFFAHAGGHFVQVSVNAVQVVIFF